jgi:hypothetical protein
VRQPPGQGLCQLPAVSWNQTGSPPVGAVMPKLQRKTLDHLVNPLPSSSTRVLTWLTDHDHDTQPPGGDQAAPPWDGRWADADSHPVAAALAMSAGGTTGHSLGDTRQSSWTALAWPWKVSAARHLVSPSCTLRAAAAPPPPPPAAGGPPPHLSHPPSPVGGVCQLPPQ